MANADHIEKLRRGREVWNSWRDESPDVVPDLSGATLENEILVGVNLSRAQMMGTNFAGAHLVRSNISRADLTRANLVFSKLTRSDFTASSLASADLSRAVLLETNLTGADLTDANLPLTALSSTVLAGAMLRRTNFSRALFNDVVLTETDLSEVKGLESVKHSGPSHLGISTLQLSRKRIPEEFLRGVGAVYHSCFISYSHKDESFAIRVRDSLAGRHVKCWLDKKDLVAGERIQDAVYEAINTHDKLLLCCSKSSLDS